MEIYSVRVNTVLKRKREFSKNMQQSIKKVLTTYLDLIIDASLADWKRREEFEYIRP